VDTSFADRSTADIYHGADTKAARRIPKELWSVARRKLDTLNRSTVAEDLKSFIAAAFQVGLGS